MNEKPRTTFQGIPLLLLIGICALAPLAWGDAAPTDGDYVKTFLVIGPFSDNDLQTDFLKAAGGETKTAPTAGDTVVAADGTDLVWKRYESDTPIVDLTEAFGKRNDVTAYLFCWLQNKIAGKAQVRLGSDDGVAVWINGQRVHQYDTPRGLTLDSDVFGARLKTGLNACLIKVSQSTGAWGVAMRVLPPERAVVAGVVTNTEGASLTNVTVALWKDDALLERTQTDTLGRYRFDVFPVDGQYDLSATVGDSGAWALELPLRTGGHVQRALKLERAIRVEGALMAYDNATPHVAVPVQAFRLTSPETATLAQSSLSDARGRYQFVNLRPGVYQIRCQVAGGYIEHAEQLRVASGRTHTGIDFRFAPFKKGTWRNFNTFNGLPSGRIYDIYYDTEGVLWFATHGGVSRFDGKTFENFTADEELIHNTVSGIARDAEGNMWFAARGGLCRYDGRTVRNLTLKDGLPEELRTVHLASDGALWFGTWNQGALRYDGKQFERFTTEDGLAGNRVYTIKPDKNGVLWFATWSGLSRYVNGRFETFDERNGLPSSDVRDIAIQPDGVMWFATFGGAARYDGERFEAFTEQNSGLADNRLLSLHCAKDGTVWFGSTAGGASRYDGSTFVNFTPSDGLAQNAVWSIAETPDGSIWFGTFGGGVSQYQPTVLTQFTVQDGLAHNWIHDIHREPDGTLWLGTEQGVGIYRRASGSFRNPKSNAAPIRTLTRQDGLLGARVYRIERDENGSIWFATDRGISRYDATGFSNFELTPDLPSQAVVEICRTSSGAIWFGTLENGVALFNQGVFKTYAATDGFPSNRVASIVESAANTVWFGTWAGHIFRHDNNGIQRFTTAEGWYGEGIYSLHYTANDVLWIGTDSGLIQYQNGEFSRPDGFPRWLFSTIHRAEDGRMWFGTDRGFIQYDGTSWAVLDMRDGLPGHRGEAIYQDAEGTIWLGTEGGLTQYQPNSVAPQVRIESVQTDDVFTALESPTRFKGRGPGSGVRVPGSGFRTPPSKTGRRVTIKYHAIDFKTVPEKRQFRYRLLRDSHAVEADWQLTTADAVDHIFKDKGRYTFEVVAIDRDLNYSQPALVTFDVVPPWYLNGWIALPGGFAFLALLAGCVGYGVHYYAQRRESQRLRERLLEQERLARKALEEKNVVLAHSKETSDAANQAKSAFLANMSHEIRTPLNAILGYAQILIRHPDLQPQLRESVETIEKSGNHLLALINEVLDLSRIEAGRIELHATEFNLVSLVAELSAMFQLRCEQKGLKWQVQWRFNGYESDEPPSRLRVQGDIGKIRQVLINLCANASKFTESGSVTLRIDCASRDDNNALFTFYIIDTGIGITPEDQPHIFKPFQQGKVERVQEGVGLGLSIAKKLVEVMGGEIGLDSNPGAGSRFFFSVPLQLVTENTKVAATSTPTTRRLAEGCVVRALVVDDISENRQVLSLLLSDIGCQVTTAESGGQALELAHTQPFDIVFLDIRMPVMDGLETMQCMVRDFGRGMKFVAISASVFAHERDRFLQGGFDAFIPKPFKVEQIAECLASLLRIEYIDETHTESRESLDVSAIRLPDALIHRITDAAGRYSVTQLKEALAEVALLGDSERRFAKHLEQFIDDLDMDAILEAVGSVTSDEP